MPIKNDFFLKLRWIVAHHSPWVAHCMLTSTFCHISFYNRWIHFFYRVSISRSNPPLFLIFFIVNPICSFSIISNSNFFSSSSIKLILHLNECSGLPTPPCISMIDSFIWWNFIPHFISEAYFSWSLWTF